jgi:streptogramin lyase
MKQHHFSLRFFLFNGLFCLLISVLTLAAPSAFALSGKITEFAILTAGSLPVGITSGPDGNLWFTESGGNQIGRITPAAPSPRSRSRRRLASPHGSRRGPMAISGSPRYSAT